MYEKHDRQIRLLGKEVQKKIMNLSLSLIDNSESFISGEILKNFILLGSTKFKINENVKKSYEKLVLNKFEDDKIFDKDFDIKIIIDSKEEHKDKDIIYVCSKCYSFKTGFKEENCIKSKSKIELDCLLGAFIVQELIKKVAGKEYLKEYKIEEGLLRREVRGGGGVDIKVKWSVLYGIGGCLFERGGIFL